MSNYSKHKERRPEDTVFSIQTILNRAGLFTTVEWMDRPFEGVCSNRVMIYPTKLGVNGKGTDEVYTLASGYAELMERMQNDLLTMRCLQPEMTGYSGFNRQPDERLMTPEEILAQSDHRRPVIKKQQPEARLRRASGVCFCFSRLFQHPIRERSAAIPVDGLFHAVYNADETDRILQRRRLVYEYSFQTMAASDASGFCSAAGSSGHCLHLLRPPRHAVPLL